MTRAKALLPLFSLFLVTACTSEIIVVEPRDHVDDCGDVCGDSIVGASEQCDPPDGTTCDESCQTIVVVGPTCGDGEINQASEQCEPPGTPAGNFTPGCSASCTIESTLCAACEAQKCDVLFGGPGAWGCADLTGDAKTACEALVTCIRDTDCAVATSDAQACYCGTVSDLGCLT
jgi:cysteine-rich repeat protein